MNEKKRTAKCAPITSETGRRTFKEQLYFRTYGEPLPADFFKTEAESKKL